MNDSDRNIDIDIAISPCPNDTFIFDGWLHGKIASPITPRVHFADIQQLNEWAKGERYPLIKISSYCYAQVAKHYKVLPTGGAIGSFGPKLVAKEFFDISQLPQKRVAVPGLDTTACLLLGALLPRAKELILCRYDMIPKFVLDKSVDAGLLIHETRFTFSQSGLLELCDLGTRFYEAYGLPVPLGVVAVHRSLPESIVDQIIQAIRASLEFAHKHPASSLDFVLKMSQEKESERSTAAHCHLCQC